MKSICFNYDMSETTTIHYSTEQPYTKNQLWYVWAAHSTEQPYTIQSFRVIVQTMHRRNCKTVCTITLNQLWYVRAAHSTEQTYTMNQLWYVRVTHLTEQTYTIQSIMICKRQLPSTTQLNNRTPWINYDMSEPLTQLNKRTPSNRLGLLYKRTTVAIAKRFVQ